MQTAIVVACSLSRCRLETFSKPRSCCWLNRWENIFPGATNNLESGTSQSWALEEWSKGAWASPTSSQDASLAAHIGAAEGRVHFAGEHASDYHGWMQGALFSGLRAAVEIHNGN